MEGVVRLKGAVLTVWALLWVAGLPQVASAGDPPAELSAKAAIAVDHRTGAVLYAQNPDLPLPPASTTKVLTAYVVVRDGGLDRVLPVSRNASLAEPSKIWLQPGWRMSALDLLYAILLNSANDASVVIAEGLSGSVAAFAREMNEAAIELGATRSQFVNPNGLPDPEHYATARDLAGIMRGALRYPIIRQVLSTQSTVIHPVNRPQRRIHLRSHNRLLGWKEGVQVIGKTGYTRAAKKCFVGAASNGDREVIIAVLGARDLWGDVQRLVRRTLPRASGNGYPFAVWDWEEAARAPQENSVIPRARPSTGRFHVRLASFSTRAKADGLRRELVRRGYGDVVVEHLRGKSKPSYRVTVRGFVSREAAREAARKFERLYKVRPTIVAVGA